MYICWREAFWAAMGQYIYLARHTLHQKTKTFKEFCFLCSFSCLVQSPQSRKQPPSGAGGLEGLALSWIALWSPSSKEWVSLASNLPGPEALRPTNLEEVDSSMSGAWKWLPSIVSPGQEPDWGLREPWVRGTVRSSGLLELLSSGIICSAVIDS